MGGGDAPAALAAAVAAGGGLGMIGGTTTGGSTWLAEQIRRARELTDRPFGVGLLSHVPNAGELTDVALDAGVKVIAHSFADPSPSVARAHEPAVLVTRATQLIGDAARSRAPELGELPAPFEP